MLCWVWSAPDSIQLTSSSILLKVFKIRPRWRNEGERQTEHFLLFSTIPAAISDFLWGPERKQNEPNSRAVALGIMGLLTKNLDISFQSPPERGAKFNQYVRSFLPFHSSIALRSTRLSPPDLIIALKSNQTNWHYPSLWSGSGSDEFNGATLFPNRIRDFSGSLCSQKSLAYWKEL